MIIIIMFIIIMIIIYSVNNDNTNTNITFLAIHAEPNPCPTNRLLVVIDFKNIVTLKYKELSKNNKNKNKLKISGVLPRIDIPIKRIIELMKTLEDPSTEEFNNRIKEVLEVMAGSYEKAGCYENCKQALEEVINEINAVLKALQ